MDIFLLIIFIFLRWSIPLFFLLINIYNIVRYKNNIKNAGDILLKKQQTKEDKTDVIYNNICMIIFSLLAIGIIIYMFIARIWNLIIVLILFLPKITTCLRKKLYLKKNGIYKNGLIDGKYITCDKIHSYKWINNETVSFLLNNGSRNNFEITDREKAMETIKEKEIVENIN